MLQLLTHTAYGVLGVVGVGLEESVCWWCVALLLAVTFGLHVTQT